MNTNKIKREQISALADGELDPSSTDAILKSLSDESAEKDWEIFHHIGDVLRSEELAAPLSTDFAARMAARLEAEAPHTAIAPQVQTAPSHASAWSGGLAAAIRRYLVPGMAGTAALATVIMMAPQWMTGAPDSAEISIAEQTPTVTPAAIIPVVAPESALAASAVSDSQTLVSENDIVRDPRIDQYLMAHQRFSPSAYSSSQFARSATFAAEADK